MTCAFAVRGALQKMPGMEKVEVSLNRGVAHMELRQGNSLSVEQFWQTVKKAGHSPRLTRVEVRGEVLAAGDGLELRIPGQKRRYAITAGPETAPGAMDQLKLLTGQSLRLEGEFAPPKDVKLPLSMVLRRVLSGVDKR